MKTIQISLNNEVGYVTTDTDLLCEELRQFWEAGPAAGDSLAFDVVEVTEEEYRSMPEFQGW